MTQQDHVAVRTLESGPAVLAIHGGGGPQSMRQIVEGLSVDHEVLLPTHPGWDGQPRDPAIRSVPDLAQRCLRLLLARTCPTSPSWPVRSGDGWRPSWPCSHPAA